MDDDELLAMIADGSISAFEQLYYSTYKRVFAFILSMVKCRHTAEDLMHDTYMRIFEKAGSYQKGTAAGTWIMTIAKNLTYDYFRKVGKITFFEENQTDTDSIYQYDPSANMTAHFELEKALAGISEIDAQIAVLYAVCGYKHREIARILSIPEGTIRRRYRKAVKQLGDAMGGAADG